MRFVTTELLDVEFVETALRVLEADTKREETLLEVINAFVAVIFDATILLVLTLLNVAVDDTNELDVMFVVNTLGSVLVVANKLAEDTIPVANMLLLVILET